ncbi:MULTISPECIES: peptide MFS transporter [Sphingosinicellaceae]|uniref:peptide MFS transporter n=1 Tax=Sphingosinicellaceae TaxID=2820280 RepID=UPI001C1E5749|nr:MULTISPECIES: peptide MFS transporter [Polymorphobacter]QYE36338.1 peptide MFS transporter [Polymorphobacter sp. PAMC 29334]UAJ11045.1 peptide MFS transporter [Polymorphobacter megasporae]
MTTEPRGWFGQPRGLTVLFLTNMWEQFSYYGMRALLVYYMTKSLLLGQGTASLVYGTYTACAYFTPIVGGVVADRFLGKRRAVIVGASIMAVGHFMMAFDGLFYPALATIAIGNGLFLPTLPSQINDLYAADDPRRAWAYNVYYVGINIGGFLAPLICGTLGEVYGWHYGFAAAGVGMVAGLAIYLWGGQYLPPEPMRAVALQDRGRFDRSTIGVLVAVALSVTVFRGAYEQVGNTVALWADAAVDRRAGSMTIPMTWFQSLNPLLVMIMTPPLLTLWRRQAAAGHQERATRRMAIGAIVVAGAYIILAAVAVGDGRADWRWLVVFFAVFTLGELFVLPTGLGLFARLAPRGLGATTVAAWYLTIFSGSLSAGLVGTVWTRMSHAAFFLMLAGIAGIAALLLAGVGPLERTRMLHKRDEED